MPRANLTVEPLIVAARGMAEAAKHHAEVLIENGLEDDFIEQLLGAARLLEESVDQRNVSSRTRIGSTAGLAAEALRGRTILGVLDSVVRRKLRDNASLRAEWDATKQIRRARSAVAPATTPTLVAAQTSAPSSRVELTVVPSIPAEAA